MFTLNPDYQELVALREEANLREWDSKSKVASVKLGERSSMFKGRGLDFSEFREYSPGDDIRSIDWRVTARKGRPHTKLFTEERERSVYVIVDMNRYMQFGTRGTFKSVQAARAAALFAWTANHLKDKTGAILFGAIPEGVSVLPARSSRESIWQMLKILCAETEGALELPEIGLEFALERARRQIPRGSCVVIISDFFQLSEEFETSLGILSRRCEVVLVKVNDPVDQKIPEVNRLEFSNDAGARTEIDTNDSGGSELYQKMWAERDARLQEMAYRFRAKILRVSTSGDVAEELFRPMAQSAKESSS
jgi:uncharacterized protein (DUF58 family)